MFCTDLSVIRQAQSGIHLSPLYCRSWQCEICAPKRARELRCDAKRGCPTTFITLTANPKWGGGPDHRAKRLVTAWRMIRQSLKRRGIADKLPFLAVFEETKKGEPHLHIICRAPFIPQWWLSDFMKKYMDSPIVDIRRVQSHKGVAKYIAKYIAKAPKVFAGCKRYWKSQNWKDAYEDDSKDKMPLIAVIRRSYPEVQEDIRTVGTTQADTLHGWAVQVAWWSGTWRRRNGYS